MSFNFGTGTQGGFSFGTPSNTTQTTTATAPTTGFSFGSAAPTQPKPQTQVPSGGTTGFALGGQSAGGLSASGGGFTPGGGTNNAGLTFGQTAAKTTPQANTTFGTPQGSNLTFATPAPSTTPVIPSQTATAGAATGGFSLGGTTGGQTGLSFGGFAPKTTATVAPTPVATPQAPGGLTGGIQFGQKATAVAAPFSLNTTTSSTLGATTRPSLAGALGAGKAPTLLGGTAPTLGGTASTLGGTVPTLGAALGQTPVKATTALSSLLGQGTAATSAPQPGLGFKLGGSAAQATTTTPAGFGLLGAGNTTAGGLTLGAATLATTTATQATILPTQGASLTTATSTSASTAAPTSMNYRQLEEAINKWTLELEEQEKIFLEQATQVNAWDRMLIDNGDKITHLNTSVERVKLDQQRLDQELDFILSQQKELEELVVPLEQAVESLPPLSYHQHADLEREHTYKLSENIDAQLKTMSRDLKEIIEHLNTSNIAPDSTDPVTQIGKILNAHMDSLNWIDQNTVLLQRRVEDVSRQADIQRKDQDRSFRHGYD